MKSLVIVSKNIWLDGGFNEYLTSIINIENVIGTQELKILFVIMYITFAEYYLLGTLMSVVFTIVSFIY